MKLDGIEKAFIIMMIGLILAGVSKQMPLQDDSQSKDIPLQPDTQGNLNTTNQSDSITTKKYTFKTYSPITERNQKYRVKEKR